MKTIRINPRAHSTDGRTVRMGCEIREQKGPAGCTVYSVTVWNKSDRPLRVDRVELFNLNLEAAQVEVFRQGFYMPGDPAGFYTLTAGQKSPDELPYKLDFQDAYDFVSHGLVVVRLPRRRKMQLFAFTTGRSFHAFWVLRTRGKTVHISAQCNLEGTILDPADRVEMEQLMLMDDVDFAALVDRYAERAARANGARVPSKTITGWSDWQYYRQHKTEQDVLRSAAAMKRLKDKGFPLDFVIVDSGYCNYSSQWLGHCDKFPSGMRALGRTLRKRYGLRMGVWFAPFVTNVNTTVAREHPDWLVIDKTTNRPLSGPQSCVGEYYVIDYSVPQALEWMCGVVRTMVRNWGAEYIKLDGPNPAKYLGGRLRDPRMTVVQMFRRSLEAIRAECGEDVLIEGEGIYGPSMGLVDIQRVQQDSWAFWTRPDRPQAGMKENLKNDLLASFLHGRVWHNHRENVILRDFPSPHHHLQRYLLGSTEVIIPENELRFQISAEAMAGGAMLLTDPMDELLRNRRSEVLISQFLPPFETQGCRPIDVFTGQHAPSLYYVPVRRDFEEWNILGVFNWKDSYQDFSVPLDHFAGAGTWHAFAFWDQTYLGVHRKNMTVKDVPAHGCRVIALRKALHRPQVIGTDIHIFQGAVELASVSYRRGVLDIDVRHITQPERRVTIWRPGRYHLKNIETDARGLLVDTRKRNLLTIHFSGRKRARLRLQFACKK